MKLVTLSRQQPRPKRRGITLLEILLALAIAAVAMSLLAQLVAIGNRSAAASRDLTKAQLVAESIMAEIAAGVMAPEAGGGPWEADPMWSYALEVAPGASENISVVTVTVTHEVESLRPASFALTQWLFTAPEPVEEETMDTSAETGGAA